MAELLVMPRLADTMEEGTIVAWLVAPGERVERGQPVCEIEMEKATLVYESPLGGTLVRHLLAEGEGAAIGAPIAEIDVAA